MARVENRILLTHNGKHELWGSLSKLCDTHEHLPYHTLARMSYPFEYNGWCFEKLVKNQQTIFSDEQKND